MKRDEKNSIFWWVKFFSFEIWVTVEMNTFASADIFSSSWVWLTWTRHAELCIIFPLCHFTKCSHNNAQNMPCISPESKAKLRSNKMAALNDLKFVCFVFVKWLWNSKSLIRWFNLHYKQIFCLEPYFSSPLRGLEKILHNLQNIRL